MKFSRRKKLSKITKKQELIYTSPEGGFTVTACRQGVQMGGLSPILSTQEDLLEMAKVISGAWQDHEELLREAKASLIAP